MYLIASVSDGQTVYWSAPEGTWGALADATLYETATTELPWGRVCWFTQAD